MFGYVVPLQSELKMRDMELYRGVYCGLCRELGRSFGPLSRLFLSYDWVFFAMALSTANCEHPGACTGRCALHPLQKRCIVSTGSALHYAAQVSMLMVWHKCRDDLEDEDFFGQVKARIAMLLLQGRYRSARADLPQADALIHQQLSELRQLERAGDLSLDAPADAFATMLADAARMGAERVDTGRILFELFYHLGRWIYLADALDDLAQDLKKKRYNPLPLRYGMDNEQSADDFLSRIRPELMTTMALSIGAACEALDLLPLGPYSDILTNIVAQGLPAKSEALGQSKGA